MDRAESRLKAFHPPFRQPEGSDNNPEKLSWEILQTRRQMDHTLDELGERLTEISRTVRKTVINSLIWAGIGIAGAAIGWWAWRSRGLLKSAWTRRR